MVSSIVLSNAHQHPNAPHPVGLLRPRRERPCRRRAAGQRDELAPPDHSITSSAATRSCPVRQLARCHAVENFMHIIASAAKARTEINSIANQPAVIDMFPIPVDGGKPRCRGKCYDFSAFTEQHRSLQYDNYFDALVHQCSKCALEVIGDVDVNRRDLHSQLLPRRLQFVQLGRCFRVAQVGQYSDWAALGTISRASSICLAGKPST